MIQRDGRFDLAFPHDGFRNILIFIRDNKTVKATGFNFIAGRTLTWAG